MTNGDSTRDDGNADNDCHWHNLPTTQPLQNYYQRPPLQPVVHNGGGAYPNYGYNTQNPPTNLWGPSTGANIAAMAMTTGQIPDNVVITNNYSDTVSWVSTISMPHSSAVASSNQTTMTTPAAPSNNGHLSPVTTTTQKPLHQIQQPHQQPPNIQPNQNRAIHRINLSSIRHNYNQVQSSAAAQQCRVIVVVKADGYGHGAILTACHLVEQCGAQAFAVATIEEGITLRRAFEEKFPSHSRVRILVLGAPVGYPNCFDSYLHNGIELMVSGPEVAASLARWMTNHDGRRRAEVERVAERS